MAVTVQAGPQAIIQAKEQIHVFKLQIDSVHREIDRLHRKVRHMVLSMYNL